MSLKIAIVGAGSAQFMHELADFAALNSIGDFELALHDTNRGRLVVAASFAERVRDAVGGPAKITAHDDRAPALDGAFATVVSIGVGMQEAIRPDFEIPARYGLRQTVADTLGIGAIVRVLRTAPVLADIGNDVVSRASRPLVLNVTNPMAMACMALGRLVPQAETIGLCHSAWQTAVELAQRLDIPVADLEYEVAGVNHQAWYTRLAHHGVDQYPRLRELAGTDVAWANTVRADLLRRLDYFPTESSKHSAEYVPWYLSRATEVDQFGLPVNPYWERRADNAEWFAQAGEIAAGRIQVPIGEIPSGEYAPRIVRSLVTGEPDRVHVNVMNDEPWIPQLPSDGVVEVPATVDGDGIHPIAVPGLAPQCIALNQRYLQVCDLAVRAVVEGRRDHIHHAAMLDPNTSATLSLDQIADMVDELLDAHQQSGRLPEVLWR